MNRLIKILFVVCLLVLPFFFGTLSHARPPRPGVNFGWVAAHISSNGIHIPGHWKHAGSPVKGKTWVLGHYNASGKWVPGHWKYLRAPRKPGKAWVPGHRGPRGRWIAGHWR